VVIKLRPLLPWKIITISTKLEAGGTERMSGCFGKERKSLAPARLRDYPIDKFQLIVLYSLCVSDVNRKIVALTYYFTIISLQISQGCTNPGYPVVLASKFSTTVPNVCGPWV
jgi:hypothetical protein